MICRQEHILLNPSYVLPEFIMHVQMKLGDDDVNNSLTTAERLRRSMVIVPNACAQRTTAPKPQSYFESARDLGGIPSSTSTPLSPSKIDALTKQLNDANIHDASTSSKPKKRSTKLAHCAQVFTANSFQANVNLSKITSSHDVEASSQQDEAGAFNALSGAQSSQATEIEMEALARSLAEFDSRSALISKQTIVRAIHSIVQGYSSKRQQLVKDVLENRA
jgi:hypothetical protein